MWGVQRGARGDDLRVLDRRQARIKRQTVRRALRQALRTMCKLPGKVLAPPGLTWLSRPTSASSSPCCCSSRSFSCSSSARRSCGGRRSVANERQKVGGTARGAKRWRWCCPGRGAAQERAPGAHILRAGKEERPRRAGSAPRPPAPRPPAAARAQLRRRATQPSTPLPPLRGPPTGQQHGARRRGAARSLQ